MPTNDEILRKPLHDLHILWQRTVACSRATCQRTRAGRSPRTGGGRAHGESCGDVQKLTARRCRHAVRVVTRLPSILERMAAPIGPYTPVVRAGDWIIVSGQLGLHEGSIVAGGVQAQTAQAIANLKSQLASVGASLGDVVKTLCFLTDLDTFATFNEAYVAGFGSHRPARSTIGVAALPAGGAVEIEAWAYVPVDHKPMTKTKPAPSRAAKPKPARAAKAQPTPSRAVKASKKK